LLAIAAVLLVPTAAAAQTDTLSNLVPDLILKGITLPGAADPGSPHAGHFTLGNPTFGGSQSASRPDLAAIGAVEAFNDRLRSQFAIVPLGSSTGGFTFTFDETTGGYSRRNPSFGPWYTERASTLGRGKASLGFTYQHSNFDSFGGLDLKDGSITFYLPHTDCCNAAAPPPSSNNPGFEGDLMEVALHLKATTDTFAVLGGFGVTDKLDLGIAIPFTRVDLEANAFATILRLSTHDTPLVHTFVQNQDVPTHTFTESGSATGVGDILLRSKYNFYSHGNNGLAVGVDVRLPTGNEDDLLGLGTTQGKFYFVMSSGTDRVMPHVNIGYTASGKGSTPAGVVFNPLGVSDEFNYAGGVEIVATQRVTIIGDLLGRTLFDAGVVEPQTKTFQFRDGAGSNASAPLQTSSTNPVTGAPYTQLGLTPGNLNLVLGSAGVKWNVMPNLLVAGNVLFPLTKGGLRDFVTVAFGLDYAF
jgi:hypothetical protein